MFGDYGHVSDLSGGEARRLVVARALAQDNPILLLDEPTSALDLGHQAAVMELIDELRRTDGLSVIAAMHDPSMAARFADRLALLAERRLVAARRSDEVLRAELLSTIYDRPLTVRTIDDQLVVLPRRRSV